MNDTDVFPHGSEDKTIPKTLWSATLIDMLIEALRKGHPDDQIIASVSSLKKRGFNNRYIVNKVRRELDNTRLNRLLAIIKR